MVALNWYVIQVLWVCSYALGLWAMAILLRRLGPTRQVSYHLAVLGGLGVTLLISAYVAPLWVIRAGSVMLADPACSAPGKDFCGQSLVALWAFLLNEPHPGPWFVVHVMRLQYLLAPLLAYTLSYAVTTACARAETSAAPPESDSAAPVPPRAADPALLTRVCWNALLLLLYEQFTIRGSLFAGYYSFYSNLFCFLLLGAHLWAGGRSRSRALGGALFACAALLLGFSRLESFVPVGVMLFVIAVGAARRRRWGPAGLLLGLAAYLVVSSQYNVRQILHLSRVDEAVLGSQRLGDRPVYWLPILALKNVALRLPQNLLGLLVATHVFLVLAVLRVVHRCRTRSIDLPERVVLILTGVTAFLVLGHKSGFVDQAKFTSLLAVPVWYLAVRHLGVEARPRRRSILWFRRIALGWSTLVLVVTFVFIALTGLPRRLEQLRYRTVPAVVADFRRHVARQTGQTGRRRACHVTMLEPAGSHRKLWKEFLEYLPALVKRRLPVTCSTSHVTIERPPSAAAVRPRPRPRPRRCALRAILPAHARNPSTLNLAVILWAPPRKRAAPLPTSYVTACGWRTGLNTRHATVLYRPAPR
ncbi:MAG: hypothetical protein ABI333_08580 [bacterium]